MEFSAAVLLQVESLLWSYKVDKHSFGKSKNPSVSLIEFIK